MKYVANPVIVQAFKIEKIDSDLYTLDNGNIVKPTKEMLSRIQPKMGDYWVIQEDGYIYLNPKEVFERKYSPYQEESFMSYKSFGYALEQLEDGECVTRACWPKGWFIYLVKGSTFQVNRKPLIDLIPEGTDIHYRGHIDLFMGHGNVMVWTPSQEDLLAHDYYIVDAAA